MVKHKKMNLPIILNGKKLRVIKAYKSGFEAETLVGYHYQTYENKSSILDLTFSHSLVEYPKH